MSICRSPLENIAYEFILTSPAVPHMSCSSLIWMVCKMRGKWLYSCCYGGCCFWDLFKTAHNIVWFTSNFFLCFVSVKVLHPYSSIDTVTAWKKFCFILSVFRLSYGQQPVNSSLRLHKAHVDITFSR